MSTVLVVDDMSVIRESIAAALQARGYHTLTASDGSEALRLTREAHPDLVLLDMAMPTMDGVVYLEALQRDPGIAQTKVILLTASHDKALLVKAFKSGARDVLLKSQFSLGELVRRIDRQLQPQADASAKPNAAPAGKGAASPEPAKPAAGGAVSPAIADRQASIAALKELKPLITRSELDALLLESGELQAMSPTVHKVLALASSSTCSMDQVTRAVKQDHAIALKIIKLANSALYTRGEPVDSVAKAVGRIGLNQIRQAVLNIGVIDSFSDASLSEHLSTALFWEHSIACALISAELARSLGGKEAEVDAASTMGLLHDVGRMVFARALRERYKVVLEVADRLALPLEQVEGRMLLANHADIMDKLLHAWKFPNELINPIALHHLSMGNIRRMSPHTVQQCAILALADGLAHAMLLGSSGNDAIYPILPFIQALRLPGEVIQRIEREVPDQTADLKLALLARANVGSWPQLTRQVRDDLGAAFHPRFIGVNEAVDSFRMFCSVAASESDEPAPRPNVFVVHIAHVREREEVSTLVQKAENELGVAGLPMVVLSPNANIAPTDRVLANRRFVMLGTPAPLARLVHGIKAILPGDAQNKAA